jgi:hypothetical protein
MGYVISTSLSFLYQIPKMGFVGSYLGLELVYMSTLFIVTGLAGRG